MPESTLSQTFSELEAEAGYFLGYGRGAVYSESAWSDRQQKDVTDSVNDGIKWFYFCGYDWSFMRPIRQITLEEASSYARLPDDFGGIEGKVRLVDSDRTGIPIEVTNEQTVAQCFFERPDQTGAPQKCAVRWLPAAGLKGSRANLYFFPAADQSYTVEVQYYFLPEKLTTSFPYAHGGAVHSDTIKSAVLAAAEIRKDNMRGPMWENFQYRLNISQDLDRRNKPQTLGYNGDPSYNMGRYPVGWRHYQPGSLVEWDT